MSYELQAEGSESYAFLGSQPVVECSGCGKLRKEVDELRSLLMSRPTSAVHQREDDVWCHSTYISEHKQTEIDKKLMDARRKAETFQEAYEKVKNIAAHLLS